MKVNITPYTSVIRNIQHVTKTPLISQQHEEPKQPLKDTVHRFIAKLQEAQNSTGQDNPKVQLLMDKFKSGKKLTAEEMNYIRQHAPGLMPSIEMITREREIIEFAMRMAPTKADVALIAAQSAKNLEKHANPEEAEIRARHLLDAVSEYQKTDEYKNKPLHMNDKEGFEEQKRKQTSVTPFDLKSMLNAYEQYK